MTTPLLSSPQIALFPLNPPSLLASERRPLSLHIPLPSRAASKRLSLIIGVSALTGLMEIEDEGHGEGREGRAKLVERSVNLEGGRLGDDIGRLMKAVSSVGFTREELMLPRS
jgi:mediator of RNA polymerase II transcription subunit 14